MLECPVQISTTCIESHVTHQKITYTLVVSDIFGSTQNFVKYFTESCFEGANNQIFLSLF